MEELRKEFANIIKDIRSKYEFTLQEFGETLGVSDVYVSRIEKGQRFPSKKVLFVILFFLDNFKDYETIDALLSLFIKIKYKIMIFIHRIIFKHASGRIDDKPTILPTFNHIGIFT